MRGIVVRNHDDGSVALGNKLSCGMVNGNNVLAACRGPELREEPPANAKGVKNKDDTRHQCQDNAQARDARARKDNPKEHEHEKNAPHKASKTGSVKLLEVNVDVMLLHKVCNSLGCLELLLAVCRGDANLVLQVVQIIMCHGHAVRPPLVTQPSRSRECAYTVLSIRLEGRRYHPSTPWTVFCTAFPPQRNHMPNRLLWRGHLACFSLWRARRTPHFRLLSKPDETEATIALAADAAKVRGPPWQNGEDRVGHNRRLLGFFEGR